MSEEALTFLSGLMDLDSATPVPVAGWQAVEILWPLNELFRPHIDKIGSVVYEARFEPEADAAIIAFAASPVSATWGAVSAGCWRVLLERHLQLQVVAIANEGVGNRITMLPDGLDDVQRRAALMLLLLLRMRLPFPVADRSHFEFPEMPPPTSMTAH